MQLQTQRPRHAGHAYLYAIRISAVAPRDCRLAHVAHRVQVWPDVTTFLVVLFCYGLMFYTGLYLVYPRAGTAALPIAPVFNSWDEGLKAMFDLSLLQKKFVIDLGDASELDDLQMLCLAIYCFFYVWCQVTWTLRRTRARPGSQSHAGVCSAALADHAGDPAAAHVHGAADCDVPRYDGQGGTRVATPLRAVHDAGAARRNAPWRHAGRSTNVVRGHAAHTQERRRAHHRAAGRQAREGRGLHTARSVVDARGASEPAASG